MVRTNSKVIDKANGKENANRDMCGISGYIDLGNETNIATLIKMNRVIKHRGPDDEGFCLINQNECLACYGEDTIAEIKDNHHYKDITDVANAFQIGFGHRRLSILDISAQGHQPMVSKLGTVVVFNGEIYNYIEIRQKLISLGCEFTTNCDTEVLLQAYDVWGEKCVEFFNGMWAFAIWDPAKKKIFCSRDRLGVKPFYYYIKENKFLFASEIKQLAQDDAIERKIDRETLAANLVYGISDYDEKTWIKDFVCLPAGCNMFIGIDFKEKQLSKEIQQYWELKVSPQNQNEDIILENMDKQIRRSIQYRMRSDVPIGALLSGGLDSSSLVTLICEERKNRGIEEALSTFTSCYDNTVHDEKKYAQIINQFNGCEEHLVYPDEHNVEEELKNLVWHLEGESGYSLLGVMQVLKEVYESGIKVVINGQNGDETLLGYERYYAFYFWELLKEGHIVKFLKEIKQASKNSRLQLKELIAYLMYFKISIIRNIRCHKRARYVSKDLKRCLNYNQLKKLLYPTNLVELQFNEIKATQLPHILRMDDRIYMAHSLESRVPFVDYEYVEMIMNVAPEIKIQDGFTKSLLRKLMDGRMPSEVTWRTHKLGFSAPSERWTNKISEEFMERLFTDARSKELFDLKEVKAEFARRKNSKEIFDFINVELFMRMFDVSA